MKPGIERHEPPDMGTLYNEASRPCAPDVVRRAAVWVIRLTVCMVCCFFSARWGAAVERRRDATIERSRPHSFQGRGELWLRCPSSTTWYSYAGDPREWREEKTEEP